jgi:hypothetical protein
LTGIDDFIYRHDLLDRSIIIHLQNIPESNRRTEKEINTEYNELRPSILGAICEAISGALADLPETMLEATPRMADFAKLIAAAESVLGWKPGSFLTAYDQSLANSVESALESDIVASTLREFALDWNSEASEDGLHWSGTATALLEILKNKVPEDARRTKSWPKTAKTLSSRLRRSGPFLRQVGIEMEFARKGGQRIINIWINASEASIRPKKIESDAIDELDAEIRDWRQIDKR